jgi:1-acyl-sn-glycerol-3-phosphate acyltransferase
MHHGKRFLKSSLYTFLAIFFLLLTKILFRVKIEGKAAIHPEESYIAVARHRSYWDVLLLTAALGWRNRIHFIARKGLLRNPVFHPLIKLYATVIDREKFSKSDFRRVLEALKKERLIGIFPEGTTRPRVDAKAGAVHFARLTGKKLLPVNIEPTGPYPPKYPFSFPRVTISIGRPFAISELASNLKEESRAKRYRHLSEQLMARVDAS